MLNVFFLVNSQSPSRMDRSIEMFMNVEKALIHAKCLSMPVILLHPDVDKTVQNRIKDIIKRHQGTITGMFIIYFMKSVLYY